MKLEIHTKLKRAFMDTCVLAFTEILAVGEGSGFETNLSWIWRPHPLGPGSGSNQEEQSCFLTKMLKTYEQYVKCPTTHRNTTLDLCDGSVRGLISHCLFLLLACLTIRVHTQSLCSLWCLEKEERSVKVWRTVYPTFRHLFSALTGTASLRRVTAWMN